MKRIILTFGLVLTGLALFSQIPRIRLNQVQKDTLWGSVLISSPVDSNLTYSRDFYIGPDTSLNFYGTVLVAGGGGGGGSFVTTTILSDSLANYILKVAGFGGDVSGTYDNLTVIDDSHNHIISNVDGLQTALDGKLTSVNAGVGLTGSGTTGSPLLVDTSGTIVSKNFYFGNLPAGGGGTVTSVSAGTQISGMSMTISNGTTTPSIATSISDAANFRTAIGAGTLSSEVDGSVTNEGTLGVSAGTASTSVITSNTSGANGVTITAAGINSISESTSSNGGTITITATEVDGSVSNEGSLSVGAGGANSSDIVSNTSGSTNVTIAGSGAVTVTESGSTITISATGGGSSFNNLTETADTVFVAKYLNVDTSTLYVDADKNIIGVNTTNPDTTTISGLGPVKMDINGTVKSLFYSVVADSNDVIGNSYSPMDFSVDAKDESTQNMGLRITMSSDLSTNFPFVVFRKMRGTLAAGQGLLNNDIIGALAFSPALTTGSVGTSTARVIAYADADATSTEAAARISFETGSTGANRAERLTIKSDGKVGIGTTAPGSQLHTKSATSNDALLVEDDSGACEAQPTTTGLTWSCSSDQRLKTDIQIPAAVLNYVKNIPLKDYTVIKTAERVMGPIAQELLETYPELVSTGEDGYYRVSSLGSWTLVKAIQEQQAIIESQKAEIEQLKTQYNELLQRIITLENK